MRWAAVALDRAIHCVQPRPLATKPCPRHADDNRVLPRHVQSQGALGRGKVARHVGAVQTEGQRASRRGRPGRRSGYDASEAKSVHRESLWNPKRERAGLAISPRGQSPLAPSLPASCRRPLQSEARGRSESHDALSTCHDPPTSGNLLARRASLNGRPEVCTDGQSRMRQAPTPRPGQPGRIPMAVCHV